MAFPAWFIDATQGNRVCDQALEVCRELPDELLLARTELEAACFRLLYDAWRAEDAEIYVTALAAVRSSGGDPSELPVYYIYVQAMRGQFDEAQADAQLLAEATTDPSKYVLTLGARGLQILCQGRFGEFLTMIREGKELGGGRMKTVAWMWVFGEAWLGMLCFDFDGVRSLGEVSMPSDPGPHSAWTKTLARLSAGYAAIDQENCGEALKHFAEVRDPVMTPKFFLHWLWRMYAQIGETEAYLRAGEMAQARESADGFLRSALSTMDPSMQALAWELASRVAVAEGDLAAARQALDHALSIVQKVNIPVAGWNVHRSAWDLCREEGDLQQAETHRAEAQRLIRQIADTFEEGEPLRESLLSARTIRTILGEAVSA